MIHRENIIVVVVIIIIIAYLKNSDGSKRRALERRSRKRVAYANEPLLLIISL